MTDSVKLLSRPTNYAIVQLPERAYPGVVFQGDSLNILNGRLHQVLQLLSDGQSNEASEEIKEIYKNLLAVQLTYEKTCETHGIKIPYYRKHGLKTPD